MSGHRARGYNEGVVGDATQVGRKMPHVAFVPFTGLRQPSSRYNAEMAKRLFQFNLRTLLLATAVIAVICWATPDIKGLIPWLLSRPREWRIERNYAKKGGDELKRLKNAQAALPIPDPDVAKRIDALEYDLALEPLPESRGGGVNR